MSKAIDAKVVLLGSASVGKTSIITRAVADFHDPAQEPTVGPSFSVKTIQLPNGCVKLWIWDTAGQERFRTLGSLYYHGAHAIVVVFSLTDKESLADAERWADEVRSNCDSVPLLYLVGNKSDLTERRAVNRADAVIVAGRLGAMYIESSAVRGQNVNEIFVAVAEQLVGADVCVTEGRSPVPANQKCKC
jgi:small GTP-binding protein